MFHNMAKKGRVPRACWGYPISVHCACPARAPVLVCGGYGTWCSADSEEGERPLPPQEGQAGAPKPCGRRPRPEPSRLDRRLDV